MFWVSKNIFFLLFLNDRKILSYRRILIDKLFRTIFKYVYFMKIVIFFNKLYGTIEKIVYISTMNILINNFL